MMMARVCADCGKRFNVDYDSGRPRLACYECVPRGFKRVRLRSGRVKLRRDLYRRRVPAVTATKSDVVFGSRPSGEAA